MVLTGISQEWPPEFICPISKSPMAEPVILSSGHSCERNCAIAWLKDGRNLCPATSKRLKNHRDDIDSLLPNLALESAIARFCTLHHIPNPGPPSREEARVLVQKMADSTSPAVQPRLFHSAANLQSKSSKIMMLLGVQGFSVAGKPENRDRFSPNMVFGRFNGANSCQNRRDLGLEPGFSGEISSRNSQDLDLEYASRFSQENFDWKHASTSETRCDGEFSSCGGLAPTSKSDFSGENSRQNLGRFASEFGSKLSLKVSGRNRPDLTSKSTSSGGNSSKKRPSISSEISIENSQDLASEFISRLSSNDEEELRSAISEIHELTRTSPESRLELASDPDLISHIITILSFSNSSTIQSEATAALSNMSLETVNKVRLVREGVLAPLVDVLSHGSSAARGHAAAAIFSLSIAEENRIVAAVLGAIPPLSQMLISNGHSASEAAAALYYLSLERANCGRIIHGGAVAALLHAAASSRGGVAARSLAALCNVAAAGDEGRAAVADGGGISTAIGVVGCGQEEEEHAVALLLLLSRTNSSRFWGEVKQGMPAIARVAARGRGRAREKAAALMRVVKEAQAAAEDGPDGGGGRGLEWRRAFRGEGAHCSEWPNTAGF
ncbi:U-box domain-containing protein 40 [Amborella trichopoda]|uniref:RING-type E3 ubiquitin transferase n=1 Tax=Amborella trichopoda TaxID=13333 RepID=W1PJK6_AMBTC|nr:U-box domain-containing protein 40 [Amborella trichopoda]ERN07924.1 hypothetical protein AMTR_s00012p00240140 [Amborella trichopoda]|eukprot:XP_006846249.1 U-box domain-containing protein 40 [Amborella trichopoda]